MVSPMRVRHLASRISNYHPPYPKLPGPQIRTNRPRQLRKSFVIAADATRAHMTSIEAGAGSASSS